MLNIFPDSKGGWPHYSDAIMSMMASQIPGVSSPYSSFCLGADQRKHQSSANFPHKGPVTRKMFPFDDVIMPTLGQQYRPWANVLDCIRKAFIRPQFFTQAFKVDDAYMCWWTRSSLVQTIVLTSYITCTNADMLTVVKVRKQLQWNLTQNTKVPWYDDPLCTINSLCGKILWSVGSHFIDVD